MSQVAQQVFTLQLGRTVINNKSLAEVARTCPLNWKRNMRTRMTQKGWRTEARRRSRNRNWKYADDDDAVGEATAAS